jgi:hypothetical protein
MTMKEIRGMAKRLGIKSFGKTKADLIREIQRAEGNFDCFGSAKDFCDQWDCLFRTLCLKLSEKS